MGPVDGSRESDNFSALKESGGERTVAIYNESEKSATSVADDIYYKVSVRGGTEHRSSSPWKLVLFVGASVSSSVHQGIPNSLISKW